MCDPFSQEEFDHFQERFNTAEQVIKRLEDHTDEGLSLPAVNQLRYAAFHMFQLVGAPSDTKRQEQKQKLKNHIDRAIYDACEGLVLFYADQFRVFQDDYRLLVITDVVPGYLSMAKTVQLAYDEVERFRAGKADAAFPENMEQLADTLKTICDDISVARPELNKKLESLNKELESMQTEYRRWRIAILMTAVSILLAVVGLLLR
jgi:hypothetical protein